MKIKEEITPFVPRAPKDHALFGERYVRNHFFIDSKWTPDSRVAQYRCMVDVLEKYKTFKNVNGILNQRKKSAKYDLLKKECSDGRIKLKHALHDDTRQIRNLLRKNKELHRLYQSMSANEIADNIHQRIFGKRKERDRLANEKKQLAESYESSLLELSRLQDLVKYENGSTLPEQVAAKGFRLELKNSETRLRALRTITRAYNTIQHVLYQDAIYYDPVLSSLQDDITEQGNFIKQVIRLGRQALNKVDSLVSEYEVLEEQAKISMQNRLQTLIAARKKTATSSSELKKLVRRNSDFEIHHQYDRDTPSMTNLKKTLEDIENIMKEVKGVTLCTEAREVYPRMKKKIKDTEKLEQTVEKMHLEKEFLKDKFNRADILMKSLKFNVTDESNERQNRIITLKHLIAEQKKIRKDIVQHISKRGQIMTYLRFSINHIVDTLRHVSEPLGIARREYPNKDLKLPLLRFTDFAPKAFPPGAFEPNPEKLLQGVKDRVQLLMKYFRRRKTEQDEIDAQKEYHEAYLRSSLYDEALDEKSLNIIQLIDEQDRDDPTVLTRDHIKMMSEKIVQKGLKQDD